MQNLELSTEERDRISNLLGQSPTFRRLNVDEREWLLRRGALRRFDGYEAITTQGEPPDGFYVLVEGEVAVLRRPEDASPLVEIGRVKAPEIIADESLLLNEPYATTICASGTVKVLWLSVEVLRDLLAMPALALTLCRSLAQRLAGVSVKAATLGRNVEGADEGEDAQLPGPPTKPNRAVAPGVRPITPPASAPPRTPGAPIPHDVNDLSRVHVALGWRPSEKAPEQPSKRLLSLMQRALADKASDIHLTAAHRPRYRVDGRLREIPDARKLKPGEVLEIVLSIMPPKNQYELYEKSQADFGFSAGALGRYRVNVFTDHHGVGAVLRLIPSRLMSPQDLGLPPVVQSLCERKKGLVLVTGPTGSGKSTTLASLIHWINVNRPSHIITLEDPIEFVHESRRALVNQREVGVHTEGFPSGLRAALREDPDIVLVGEIRDRLTVSLALETANTGHLVFGTMHTSDAVSTVDRMVSLFPPEMTNQIRQSTAETLIGVVSQTLVPRIGGGRVAGYEIVIVNSAIANLIREGKYNQLPTAISTSRKQGHQMLNDHLAYLVRNKQIDYNDALRHAVDPGDLIKRLSGGVEAV